MSELTNDDGARALVAPFRAVRFSETHRLRDLISPPYDVITPERRSALAAADAHNIVRLILPEGDERRYERAAGMLAAWRTSGVLVRDERPSVYVVQQEFDTPDGARHRRTGVIGALHVEPYDTGRVLPHERTHRGPKEDRLALSRATNAMLESIFVLARDAGGRLLAALRETLDEPPTAHGELDGVDVRLWHVAGQPAEDIASAAGNVVYIADGHHRYETANAYRQENPGAERIPALIVPVGDPGLVVLPTHRLVPGTPEPVAPIVDRWRSGFSVEAFERDNVAAVLADLPTSDPACVVVTADTAYRLVASAKTDAVVDIAHIEEHVVAPLLEAAGADHPFYSASVSDAVRAIQDGAAGAAVLVQPTPVDRVMDVSDAGGIMPPKSTYFAPKVPSGLVIMSYGA